MKRAVAFVLAVAVLSLIAASASSQTPPRHTWLICDNGTRYTHHPRRCEFREGNAVIPVQQLHWRHWGALRATARAGAKKTIRVVAHRRTMVRNCVHRGADWFYERVRIHAGSVTEHIDGSHLKPQCNNP
jgi:hypothetical protein